MERELCGAIFAGGKVCAVGVGHKGQHRSREQLDAQNASNYGRYASNPEAWQRKLENQKTPSTRASNRAAGRKYKQTAAGILALVRSNAKRRGNR